MPGSNKLIIQPERKLVVDFLLIQDLPSEGRHLSYPSLGTVAAAYRMFRALILLQEIGFSFEIYVVIFAPFLLLRFLIPNLLLSSIPPGIAELGMY